MQPEYIRLYLFVNAATMIPTHAERITLHGMGKRPLSYPPKGLYPAPTYAARSEGGLLLYA